MYQDSIKTLYVNNKTTPTTYLVCEAVVNFSRIVSGRSFLFFKTLKKKKNSIKSKQQENTP